jgi:excisionase family DNA binding protein
MKRPEDTYLKDKREAACYLNISAGSLERLMRGGLPYVKLNGLVRFRPEDLADFIESRRVSLPALPSELRADR